MPTHDVRTLSQQLERLFVAYPALPFLEEEAEEEPVVRLGDGRLDRPMVFSVHRMTPPISMKH